MQIRLGNLPESVGLRRFRLIGRIVCQRKSLQQRVGIQNVRAMAVLPVHIVTDHHLWLKAAKHLHFERNPFFLVIDSPCSLQHGFPALGGFSQGPGVVRELSDHGIMTHSHCPQAVQLLMGASRGIPVICAVDHLHISFSFYTIIGKDAGKKELFVIGMR